MGVAPKPSISIGFSMFDHPYLGNPVVEASIWVCLKVGRPPMFDHQTPCEIAKISFRYISCSDTLT